MKVCLLVALLGMSAFAASTGQAVDEKALGGPATLAGVGLALTLIGFIRR